jgi:hypothetical protein
MMKRALYIVLLVAMLGLSSCRKKNVIPDDTLAEIFHDAFVVNAYVGEKRIDLDSLQIYEPIFNRYGYTAKDVVYTVGNFSRRKSARLGTVVEQAISRLEQESKEFGKKVVVLDTIRNVAVRTFTRTIYNDTLITAKKRADSTALLIEIAPAPKGEYTIMYSYKCEDDLEKYPRSAEFYFTDDNGYHNGRATITLRKSGIINRTLVAREDNRSLVLNLGKYTDLKKAEKSTSSKKGKRSKKSGKPLPPKTQDLEIRNLRVQFKLNTDAAIDSLFSRYVDIKIFADGFLVKKDSLALSADSTRISTTPALND